MKKVILTVGLIFTFFELHAHDLTIVVTGLRNDRGEVQFSLYNKEGTIPDKALDKYYKMERVPITGTTVKALFKDLPEGRYAVSVFHDENNNSKIDKGLLMPKEGVGLSNYKTINLFNLPNFKKASFPLNRDKEVRIGIIYL